MGFCGHSRVALLVSGEGRKGAKAIVVLVMVVLLYYAIPSARLGELRSALPAGVAALVVWLVVSAAFAVHVANVGSYNKTYGAVEG